MRISLVPLVLSACVLVTGGEDPGEVWQVPAEQAAAARVAKAWREQIAERRIYAELESNLSAERLAELTAQAEDDDGLAVDALFYAYFVAHADGSADFPTARRWYEAGKRLGSPVAMLYHGRCLNGFHFGDTLSPTVEQRRIGAVYIRWALQVFEPLAESGDATAAYFTGAGYSALGDAETAERWYRESFRRKSLIACLNLANLLLDKEEPSSLEISQALTALNKAEENDCGLALLNLGRMHERGDHVAQDMEKALAYYRRAAAKNLGAGLYAVARCHFHGLGGLEADREKAHRWLLRAADQGSALGRLQAAHDHMGSPHLPFNPGRCLELLKRPAERGLPRAMLLYTELLVNSGHARKVEEDRPAWIQRCIDAGLHHGHHLYIDWYRQQDDWDRVTEHALQVIAAEGGENCPKAFTVLGLASMYGRGIMDANPEAGREYLNYAAKRGTCEARFFLGLALYHGWGGPKDLARARKLFRISVNHNCNNKWGINCQFRWAMMAKEGLGGDKNQAEAVTIMRKCAGFGIADASAEYGLMCKQGLVPDSKPDEHIRWYKRGIRNGSGYAHFLMGQEEAVKDDPDPNKVSKFYLGAISKGYDEQEVLDALVAIRPQVTKRKHLERIADLLDEDEDEDEEGEQGDAESQTSTEDDEVKKAEVEKAKERIERARERDKSDPHANESGHGVDEF